MAVNINNVYTRVQSIANKEQRGYLTPIEYNRFANQAQLQDTPGFFDNTKVPDAQISDNNTAAYFMIGGSDAKMDALTDLQYK